MSDVNFWIDWGVREWFDRETGWCGITEHPTREAAEKYVQRFNGDPDYELVCRRVYRWHRPDEEEPQ